MDRETLLAKRFTPTFNGNDKADEPMVVRHKSLRQRWLIDSIEIAAEQQALAEAFDAAETPAEKTKRGAAVTEFARDYEMRVLKDHVVGVDGMGADFGVTDLLTILEDERELRAEIVAAITDSGQMTEDEAKN